ncbi:uncharacterized protein C8orf34 homolog isoform X2 [Antedon mediterranea]|uniref:uncharacterized protein C8orf34 homolog isoform X2 n=1 Tax=Antedon mediterranea TaxID=105859 RepID=UPI003AF5FB71
MAASQHKVQSFLEKHRIGGLFEDLMSRLIKDLPAEPIPYLVKVLNRIDQRKQENPLNKMRPSSTLPAGRKSLGGNADPLSRSADAKSMWASTDKKSEKPEWDNKVTKSTGDFDDLFQESQKVKNKSVAFSKGASGHAQWAIDDDDDLKYTSSTQARRKIYDYDDDPLSGELTADKLEKKYGRKTVEDKRMVSKTKVTSTKRGYGHKEELAALAKQQVTSSGYLDGGEDAITGDDGDYDSAIDMLEDIDALRSEGVVNAKATGHKLSKRDQFESPEATVKISICSRCARLAGAENSSEYGGPANPYRSFGAASDYADSQAGGFQRVSQLLSDDEFESVSQVEGPRYPVWESDDSSLTSRSQRHQHITSGKESPISDVIETPHTSLGWCSLTQQSETEAATKSSDLANRGRSWHRAPSDDGSSFDWNTDRKGNSTRFTKSGRPPSGN